MSTKSKKKDPAYYRANALLCVGLLVGSVSALLIQDWSWMRWLVGYFIFGIFGYLWLASRVRNKIKDAVEREHVT